MSKKYVREPKEPLPLFTQREDGVRQEKAFACGECGLVYGSRDSAIYCCKQQVCESCGGDAPKAWILCSPCRDQKMWDNAEEIKEHDGPVYDESRDRYFSCYEEAVEWFMDNEEEDRPEFLQPCLESRCPKIDVDYVLENLVEELFEDAYDHLKGVEELRKACAEFDAKQTLTSWSSDPKRKIRLVIPSEVAP